MKKRQDNRKMPTLPVWLLHRLGVAKNNGPLVGDLAEEFQSGKSAIWYWLQTFAAISGAIARDLRGHKLLAVRAIVAGWLLLWLLRQLMTPLIHWLQFTAVTDWTRVPRWAAFAFTCGLWVLFLIAHGIVGWLIAFTHRAQSQAMVLVFVSSMMAYQVYDQIGQYHHPTSPIPYQWAFNLVLSSLAMLCVVAGGFIYQPRLTSTTTLD